MPLPRINKEVFQALLEKTGKSPRRIYQMIQKKREEYDYTISRETAANLLAAQMKIDISKFLEEEKLDELRKLREIPRTGLSIVKPQKHSRRQAPEIVSIQLGEKLLQDFVLPKKLANEAKRMADVYPMLYVLENSLRHIIMHVLKNKYGERWWEQRVPLSIRKKVEIRMKQEGRNRWHSRRGSHKIFYTDFGDLSSIIINNWDDFKEWFPSQRWIQTRLEEIELSRNIIAHNNPLPKREIRRLRLYFEDLRKQISR